MIALSIIVPAYNEAERLPATLHAIRAFLDETGRNAEVIVVDDGSTDATSAVVRGIASMDERLALIRLPQNRGKGYAVRTGVVNAAGERVLFADADGATPIEELARLETHLEAGAQIAIGSRGIKDASVTVHAKVVRRLAGRLFHQLVSHLTVHGFVDTQCGFKLFRREAARAILARSRLYRDGAPLSGPRVTAFDVELLVVARALELRVCPVPVVWTYGAGSKVHPLKDSWHNMRDLLRVWTHKKRGRYR